MERPPEPPREHPVNANVAIRACSSPERSLGLFASQRMTKGLKIMSEEPLLIDESRQDMIATIDQDILALSPAAKALITRMYAGPLDIVPVLTGQHVREQREQLAVASARLQQIVRLNSVEGAGTGCILSPALSSINRECIPNAFAYYNWETGLVTLHALRDIQRDEEVTISYLQDDVYYDSNELCSPDNEAHASSEHRRSQMKVLRDEIAEHYRSISPTRDETMAAIAKVRDLIGVLKEEGLFCLEMALRIMEQSRLHGLLGDREGAEIASRRSMIVQRLCIGFEHPSCRQ
ncbi:SET domain-containing protein 5 [Apiospora hydei]|uniref:SET domain-containing protein 5 n=1 Tax=Apiospora hydei TaxID=1337664 RepID=A0ABR1WXI1_9PEZI